MKKISEILKSTREDLDFTQIDVMHRTGINNKTLSGYENGVSEPDLKTFATLLNLYDLSADDVLEIKKHDEQPNSNLNSIEKQLVSYFRQLTLNRQEDLLIMLKALAASEQAKNK